MPHDNGATKTPHCECGAPVTGQTWKVITGDHEEVNVLYRKLCGRVLGVFGQAQQR